MRFSMVFLLIVWMGMVVLVTPSWGQEVEESGGRHILHEKSVRLAHQDQNVVRSGPGDGFAIHGVYPKGSKFPVIAKSGDCTIVASLLP